MKKIFFAKGDVALLITRLIIGGIFIASGWMKISDMTTMIGYFSSMHIPAFLTYVVGYGEFIGGILLVLGLWTCWASAFLSIVMVVAVYETFPMGMTGYGFPLAVLAATISIMGNGSGKYSVKKCSGSCSCSGSCGCNTTETTTVKTTETVEVSKN